MKRFLSILLLSGLFIVLDGCGQKGNLYLDPVNDSQSLASDAGHSDPFQNLKIEGPSSPQGENETPYNQQELYDFDEASN